MSVLYPVVLPARNISPEVEKSLEDFTSKCEPLEEGQCLIVLEDRRTNALYCECHIKGSTLSRLATTDVPLDLTTQPQYKANRDVLLDDPAFKKMKDDAKQHRSFSNIVAEYTIDSDPAHPLKIVGGQHRFWAINEAFNGDVDEHHGVKVYFGLNKNQRLDVQLISNTNIAISRDLFDRLQETFVGPHLRDWCHKVGLLATGKDFADKYKRGGPISVRMAKTFVTNYVAGSLINPKEFATTDTAPMICPTGEHDPEWENLKLDNPRLWSDPGLMEAATEFSKLVVAQRGFFKPKGPRLKGPSSTKPDGTKSDYLEKAWSPAIYTAWAYVAGLLKDNKSRLKHHYAIRNATGRDPLNAPALTLGRHKSDPSNYRGLGYRSDPRERGRFVELFYFQAEKGTGITPANIKVAIAEYHAKQGILNAARERDRASGTNTN